jgi:hypothetical protein
MGHQGERGPVERKKMGWVLVQVPAPIESRHSPRPPSWGPRATPFGDSCPRQSRWMRMGSGDPFGRLLLREDAPRQSDATSRRGAR